MATAWRLYVEAEVPTHNKMRKLHYQRQAAVKRSFAEIVAMAIKLAKIPKGLSEVVLHATHYYHSARPTDTDATGPAVKATLDALVSMGIIEDDGPNWVREVTHHLPIKSKHEAWEIVLVATDPEPLVRPELTTFSGGIGWSKPTNWP